MTASSEEGTAQAQAGERGQETLVPSSLRDLVLYFLRLGTFGFGGPVALVGYMQRDLVEKHRWISKDDYKEGLTLSQLAPRPLATQLAIYIGWVRSGILGATLTGIAFVLPSFLMVFATSALHIAFGGLPWMQGLFYGIGAAVIGIIARSAYKLGKLTLGADWLLWVIFLANAGITGWKETEIVWVFLTSGIAAILNRSFPSTTRRAAARMIIPPWFLTGVQGVASGKTLWTITWFFTQAGAFVFGSGLAIVPFLYGGVVQEFHSLNDRQFLDAIAVAMITPGPVVITVAFVGYLAAGPVGATFAALGVFLPCSLFVIVLGPFFHKIAKNLQVRAFVDGVTAAATGAITGATFVLARRAVIDIPTAAIAALTVILLFTVKKSPEPILIGVAGLIGLGLKGTA